MSLAVLLLLVLGTQAYPSLAFTSSEQGVKEADLTSQNQYMTFAKSLYKNAEILVHIVCPGDAPAAVPTGANATRFRIGWRLRQSPCAEEYAGVDKDARRAPLYYEQPELVQVKEFNYKQVKTKKFPDWNQGDADQCLCNTASLPNNFQVRARVEIVNRFGYLSAIDWPLLPFFGSMCLLYLLFGLLWLGLCAKYWREMLRIQFCISGVIFLGMLEKALFYAEYQSINSTGVSVRGAVMLAELVSCVKRSVARMLVLIVCLGYGIVKPRLGQLQHKVIAIGLVYFIFSAVESSIRAMRPRFDQSRNAFYATIPLAVTDAIICWWIFSSLVQTIRNLRVRRNLVKLSLYRHFTNTLVFCVVCSVVFMTWTVSRHKFALCIAAWRELWIDDAFWHLLFSVILFVIIILWRPSQNNQRYAFTPLLDAGNDSDEDEEVVMDNLAEGVKARGSGASAQQQQQQQRSRQSSKGEDSLRWVEENIPQSLVESTLPSLLQDSDEEVLTTKYEMSKLL
uniref:Transmembrane protein 87A n=1 Tax=Macrostomum lignano TaxID=282301 RepID=A0A1I8HQ42_9PLAT